MKAAAHDTSVSALVREFLEGIATEESEFDRLAREERALRSRLFGEGAGLRSSENLSRDALHDRDALR